MPEVEIATDGAPKSTWQRWLIGSDSAALFGQPAAVGL